MGVFRGFLRRNVKSHVDYPRNVSTENMTRPGEVKNVPKTAKIEGYYTCFRTISGPELWTPRDSSYGHVSSLEMSHVAWNKYVDVFTFISRQFWVSREINKWGCLKAFRYNANCAKDPRNVTSHVGIPRNASGENIVRPRKSPKMSPKQPKLKVIVHDFGLSRGPSSERHRIQSTTMGVHWKGVMWFGTNIWMPLRSLRDDFVFHEKRTNGVFRGFARQCKLYQAHA